MEPRPDLSHGAALEADGPRSSAARRALPPTRALWALGVYGLIVGPAYLLAMWVEMQRPWGGRHLEALWLFQRYVDDLVAAAASPALVIPVLAAGVSLALGRWHRGVVAGAAFVLWAGGAWAVMDLRGLERAVDSAPVSFAAMLVAYAWLTFPRERRASGRWRIVRRALAAVPGVALLALVAFVRLSTPSPASLVGCYALTAQEWPGVFTSRTPEVVVLEPGSGPPRRSLLGASEDLPMRVLGEDGEDELTRQAWHPAPAGGVALFVLYPFGGRLAFLTVSPDALRGTVTHTTDVRGNEESTQLVARRIACPPGEPDSRRSLPDFLGAG